MVKFVEVPLDGGDPNRAVDDLKAAITESGNNRQTDNRTQDTRSLQQPNVDPRFAGKSIEDVIASYRNLESHSGRLANQLGETKQALNQIILEKRTNDIRQNGGTVESVKIQPTDLMVNPTEAIDRLLDSRLSSRESALQKRLNDIEAKFSQSTFTSRHSNAQEETLDPAFQAWAQQTPLRQNLLAQAANNNFDAADALLTEWKMAKPQAQVTQAETRAQELARRVSLESSNAGSESGNGKRTGRTFKRGDLIALRQRNPDLYESEAYQKEIVKAYREGRVVD